ncbi:A/G-specific adenine glycosylase [Sphingomonas astaxanthinifaciens]|uniref:Adenine DNA glycosylase n=1 Tax=Sphingomonas astaxanthinifaciens DSM 22298 TaxID=1123267 RepID=A0ABQ5Z3H5_9SPHN|nr:A/G-specific adenine glycosylase [Sphingomonas astaxanthinifaciens]GLR47338.1 A/G-specific adenine glycosylase [Sphingomonas astaxanthinifaciens DSM 22298]
MDATAAAKLLDHYQATARDLPWRRGERDPYRTWLSEVMLQQTTVATVTPRFRRFLERWPTVEALAAAKDEDILGEWAGLGYYARARNLIACARAVAERGSFPETESELRKLPGLGAYTAAAVAAIAFGEDAVPVDTNVERVVARVFGLANRADVPAAAKAWFPTGRHGDFAQALMDLGASLCRPKKPECGRCPLEADCRAAALGKPEAFPAPKVKKERPHRHGVAWWIRRGDEVWLVRRPAEGLLGGMAALPGGEWDEAPAMVNALAIHRHGFTHFTLDLHVVPRVEPPPGEGWWQPLGELDRAGLPTLYRRAVEAALKSEREPRLAD